MKSSIYSAFWVVILASVTYGAQVDIVLNPSDTNVVNIDVNGMQWFLENGHVLDNPVELGRGESVWFNFEFSDEGEGMQHIEVTGKPDDLVTGTVFETISTAVFFDTVAATGGHISVTAYLTEMGGVPIELADGSGVAQLSDDVDVANLVNHVALAGDVDFLAPGQTKFIHDFHIKVENNTAFGTAPLRINQILFEVGSVNNPTLGVWVPTPAAAGLGLSLFGLLGVSRPRRQRAS